MRAACAAGAIIKQMPSNVTSLRFRMFIPPLNPQSHSPNDNPKKCKPLANPRSPWMLFDFMKIRQMSSNRWDGSRRSFGGGLRPGWCPSATLADHSAFHKPHLSQKQEFKDTARYADGLVRAVEAQNPHPELHEPVRRRCWNGERLWRSEE